MSTSRNALASITIMIGAIPTTVQGRACGTVCLNKPDDSRHAGFDFVVTRDGQWVMLEANTGPQIGWLEAATGAAMVETMATMLAKGTL